MVSSLDLPATILSRAGITSVNGMQGLPLFTPDGQPSVLARDAVLVEESQQRAYLGFEKPVRLRTLVTCEYRLSVFVEGEWGELYDLKDDPLERVNLWDVPDAQVLKCRLLHRLVQVMIEHADSSPRPSKVA